MHPAMPIMLAVLALSRGASKIGVMLTALLIHESAHALCAYALGVRVEQIELMPFGGAVRLEGFSTLLGWRGAAIAAAGPLANLLVIMSCATLVRYEICTPETLRALVDCNAALMLLNLLPVLPMDGGRIVCALLAHLCGDTRSRKLLSVLGGCASMLLLSIGVYGAWKTGRVNMTLFLMGSYLLYAAAAEYRIPYYRQIENGMEKQRRVLKEDVVTVREVMAYREMPVYRLAAKLNPHQLHRIYISDGQSSMLGVIDEDDVVRAMLKNPVMPLQEILDGKNHS